jgi:hypothetical protein
MSTSRSGKQARGASAKGLPGVEEAYAKVPVDEANARVEARRAEVAKAYEEVGPVAGDVADPARLCRALSWRFYTVAFSARYEGGKVSVRAEPVSQKAGDVFSQQVSPRELEAALGSWPEHAVLKAFAEGYGIAEAQARDDAKRAKDEEECRFARAVHPLGPLGFFGPFSRFGG